MQRQRFDFSVVFGGRYSAMLLMLAFASIIIDVLMTDYFVLSGLVTESNQNIISMGFLNWSIMSLVAMCVLVFLQALVVKLSSFAVDLYRLTYIIPVVGFLLSLVRWYVIANNISIVIGSFG